MEEKQELEKDEFQEKIEERMTTSFTISYIPINLFRWFKKFCQEETRDNYSMGIKILKCYRDFYVDLIPHLSALSDRLNSMEERIERIEGKNEKIKLKTFGENDNS